MLSIDLFYHIKGVNSTSFEGLLQALLIAN